MQKFLSVKNNKAESSKRLLNEKKSPLIFWSLNLLETNT